MKKILYLCDFNLDTIGGAQKSLVTICEEMSHYYDVYVTSEKSEKQKSYENTAYTVLEFKKPNNKYLQVVSKLLFLIFIVCKYRPDIIHAQFAQYSYVLILARKFKLISSKIRCIYTDRHFFDGYNLRYQKSYIENIEIWSDVIFTTHINMNRWFEAIGKENLKNTGLHVVPNVLEDRWFQTSDELHEYEPEKLIVGFSGRYVDWKRWDIVYEMCKFFESNEKISFKIALTIGTGSKDDLSEMNEYINSIKRLKNSHNIEVKLDLTSNEMMQFYDSIDVFVLTSENESFGRTLIEAMARKTAVLTSNSGGAPEVIGNPDFTFELSDISKAISKIEQYTQNSNQLMMDKLKFYERASKIYRVSNLSIALRKIYEEFIYSNY